MKRTMLITLVAVQMAVASVAVATDINFSNIQQSGNPNSQPFYWPGYTPTGNSWNYAPIVGDPDITGGTVRVNNGHLSSVKFNLTAPNNDWEMLAPGNLFIGIVAPNTNIANGVTWDYVVNTLGNPANTQGETNLNGNKNGNNDVTLNAGNYNVYNISNKGFTSSNINNPNYVVSGTDNTGIWAGYDIRENHPIGIDSSYLSSLAAQGTANFTGFGGPGFVTNNTASVTYQFGTPLSITPGDEVVLGWETTCANDVLYEAVPTPTPEPGTMMLLGFGLAGLAVYCKRRVNKA